MRLDKYISRSRVLDLGSADMEGALVELLNLTVERFPDLNKDALLKGLLRRENTMTTYLGLGVAMPHVRVKMGRRYILAIGRSHYGIRYDGAMENEPVRLVFMLIADEKTRDYLQLLAALARLMKEQDFVDSLVQAPDLDALYDRLFTGFGGMAAKPVAAPQTRVNRVVLRESEKIAAGSGCTGLMVFGDTFTGSFKAPKWTTKLKTILVTRNLSETDDRPGRFDDSIQVRSFSSQRMAQLRSAVLVGITRGLITFNDRICCVGGLAGSNQFDSIVIVDVEKEFSTLLTGHADLLPPDVKPEVLERVIAVATELAVEGREGRPVGCLFVVGDSEKLATLTKPLVLNPFYGYKEEDRNILNPFMDETIKEFSSIDGAFVIRGDGVVEAAGSLIQASDYNHALPSGLGARHAAAAAISVAADCIALVVSSSSGQVTLFRRGVMMPLTEKKVSA
ncbi:PTS sugar transporter subunit IIA [Opitutus sp. GAS368]|jgi:diadenylate cyclase|uniref:PTS sugar transporter subunit IIA n=1 Tax=Opitutus sp. GAS368 TaxID=1882749 RepID=UPI00087997FF|nr:PTS sugar transporter subunit IIA [Opitutus sp. GAS368]SDR66382.1 Diadenylate cyclase (c-di-AMP synthetase), DisA_N domain [Opitutus sp. GAS368]